MSISKIQLGQVWESNETGDNWLVTKVYSEVFTSYAVLRKVGGIDSDIRRVKVERSEKGVVLPGFTFAQDSEPF